MKPIFFSSPSEFRDWLELHHTTAQELWVGFYKRNTGQPSITWSESVDVALCFGWIDGIRKTLDEQSYVIRFTRRRPNSSWSEINLKKVKDLHKLGLMKPAGMKVFKERKEKEGYSIRQRKNIAFGQHMEQTFRKNKKAWKFFQELPPGYQRNCIFWVTSAKQEETQKRRLATLIEHCAKRRRM